MNLPEGDTGFDIAGQHVVTERGLAWRTIQDQWPEIVPSLDSGIPVILGVVTVASASPAELGLNHQVLAYGYDDSPSQITVAVYDPNGGQDDGIHIQFDPRAPADPTAFAHNLHIGHPVRGFFPYRLHARDATTPLTPAIPRQR
jgi:hypothetical protein